MALAIRLARAGAKKRPYYRIVVADTRSPRDGRFIERLGTYNPLLPKDHEQRVRLFEERAQYWLDQGARPSDRVSRFLEARGIVKPKTRNNPQKGEPGERAKQLAAERKEREEAAAKAAEEAAAAKTEEPAAEEAEAPAEESGEPQAAETAETAETAEAEKAAETPESGESETAAETEESKDDAEKS